MLQITFGVINEIIITLSILLLKMQCIAHNLHNTNPAL